MIPTTTEPSKLCRHCGETKPFSELRTRRCRLRSGEARPYVLGWCKECYRAYQRRKQTAPEAKGRRMAWHRKKNFGLTPEAHAALLARQGGVCAICKRPESKIDFRTGRPHELSVDHHHETNKTRGLLCNVCNRGLGLFQDSTDLLRAAAEYLDAHR